MDLARVGPQSTDLDGSSTRRPCSKAHFENQGLFHVQAAVPGEGLSCRTARFRAGRAAWTFITGSLKALAQALGKRLRIGRRSCLVFVSVLATMTPVVEAGSRQTAR